MLNRKLSPTAIKLTNIAGIKSLAIQRQNTSSGQWNRYSENEILPMNTVMGFSSIGFTLLLCPLIRRMAAHATGMIASMPGKGRDEENIMNEPHKQIKAKIFHFARMKLSRKCMASRQPPINSHVLVGNP